MDGEIGPTRRIAEYVAETKLSEIPAEALAGAKLSILDTLGCGYAALSQPVARSILDYVESLGGAEVATVLGASGYKTSAPLAALANGCLVNILDYDGFFHVPTHTLPSAIAVGEMIGATGAQVIEAFILASEVANRLQKVIEARRNEQAGPTYRGWYHVSLYGPLTAALAAGKVLGLDAAGLQAAMGAAANSSGGVRQNLGAKAKSLLSGNSASMGVQAALLTQRGVGGDPNILEARVGLVNAICLPGEFDWAPLDSLGDTYALGASSLGSKKYPAVGPTQSIIGTVGNLRQTGQFTPDEVDWVEAHVATFSAIDADPEDELAAGFSWPYILAATVTDGAFLVDHLSMDSIHDPRIRAMSAKIHITPPLAGEPERVALHLRNGRVVEAPIEARLGRLDREGMLSKFRAGAGRRLTASEVETLYERVMGLESLGSIGELTMAMTGS